MASLGTHSIDLELSSSQYLSITDAAQTGLDITGDITIELWVKPESLTTWHGLLGKYISNSQESYVFQYQENGASSQLYLTYSDDGVNADNLSVTYQIQTGVWTHLAATLDVSTSQAKFYVNGSQQGTTQTGTRTSIYNGTAPFEIGSYGGGSNFYDGLIDEVRIWNDVRTDSEIADNYQSQLVGNEANLQAYWKLNNALTDSTSNGNTLTNNNSAVFSTDVPTVPGSGSTTTIPGIGLGNNSYLGTGLKI